MFSSSTARNPDIPVDEGRDEYVRFLNEWTKLSAIVGHDRTSYSFACLKLTTLRISPRYTVMRTEHVKAQRSAFNPRVHPDISLCNLSSLSSNACGRAPSCLLVIPKNVRSYTNCRIYPFHRWFIRGPFSSLSLIFHCGQTAVTPHELRRANRMLTTLLTEIGAACRRND